MAPRYPTPPDEVPVEPIDWPERLSQTLLRDENRCPRKAYYYVKYMGSGKTHPMDRGTLAHKAAEHLMADRMIYTGEGEEKAGQPESYVIDTDLPADAQEEALSMQTGALVDELRRKLSKRLHIPSEEADIARICTFHLALGLDVDPQTVLGIERKWVLDLSTGWEVSVKADLISLPSEFGGQVDDYKTSMDVPSASEWDTFQVRTGALALLYGAPVEREPCPRCGHLNPGWTGEPGDHASGIEVVPCPECDGRGDIEVRGENLVGRHLSWVRGREIYPRPKLRRDGTLYRNDRVWTRLELDEFRSDLEFAGERIAERLLSWIWPARKGSWCSECAGRFECPIAPEMRGFAGAIEDREHAGEVWQLSMALKDLGGDLEKIVKEWSKASGESVTVGDLVWAWSTSETRAVKRKGKNTDWEGLEEAIRAAVDLGHPFSLSAWLKTNTRQEFKKTKINTREGEVPHVGQPGPGPGKPGESAADDGSDARRRAGLSDRFGDDAPF